jgi:hypothetical protein
MSEALQGIGSATIFGMALDNVDTAGPEENTSGE